ncbi:phosphatase inhibitor-domain-containing protein [Schizophyllum amplum]|uniref:Type 1 phosphatases regulator n=1 Tax=Schizophyllum amplum TaxID=97359 RepID=A0A550CCN4_9AGAR|nr:phosphatase inhibitor-domain-containing protein [Auriculariopsis ampla]
MAYSQQTRTPNDASRTVTVTPAPAPEEHEQPPQEVGSVRLRGARRQRPHVVWDEAVVDNEGAGKKKSKICCIYHKPRRFDESSDESSRSRIRILTLSVVTTTHDHRRIMTRRGPRMQVLPVAEVVDMRIEMATVVAMCTRRNMLTSPMLMSGTRARASDGQTIEVLYSLAA